MIEFLLIAVGVITMYLSIKVLFAKQETIDRIIGRMFD